MEVTSLDLSGIFGLVQSGSAPDLSRDHLALGISSVVHSRYPTQSPSALSDICLCLSLTDRIINQRSAGTLPHDVREFYEDVTRTLFREMDLMRGLISLLHCEDQLVSHLSAKCISSYVVHDIINTGGISSLWMQTCYDAFHNVTASSELDSCLWSLTAVMKQVLKGSSRNAEDVLSKLLSGLEGSLTCLYLRLLPRDSKHPPSRTLCMFFELLEVLNAARFQTGLSSPPQTAIFRESRALLRVTRADVEYLVKKRALLLLKRSFLRRCGEDWALADHHSGPGEDPTLSEDMLSMARAVLQEVDSDWLRDVPVMKQASFFGGNCDEGLDHVILRAVSLIVLKSMDVVTRSVDKSGASLSIQPCLTELLRFLQHHVTPFASDSHGCCWVSTVFAEQDDDVIEAANTLIGLYLYHCSVGSSEPEVCLWGCNPHCHFVLLLRSLSFDHTVLLDFLISSETCFLEYCVRYLKLLLKDPRGLLTSCRRITSSETWRTSGLVDAPRLVDQETSRTSGLVDAPRLVDQETWRTSGLVDAPRLVDQETSRTSGLVDTPRLVDYRSSRTSGLVDAPGLVDYRSSRTSGLVDAPRLVDQETSRTSGLVDAPRHVDHGSSRTSGLVDAPRLVDYRSSRTSGLVDAPRLVDHETSRTSGLVDAPRLVDYGSSEESEADDEKTCPLFYEVITCLLDLKKAIVRLHVKRLFPYNPNSLLKLLSRVESSAFT